MVTKTPFNLYITSRHYHYLILFGVMLGPYIKSRGTWGTKMSANADLITVETYVQPGKTIENQFFIYGVKCFYFFIFGYLRGPGGAFNDQTGPILLSSYPLTHI